MAPTPPNQRKTIIILAAALLAVLVVSAAVLFLLPNNSEVVPGQSVVQDELEEAASGVGFNLQVLERSAYKALNSTLLQNGLLPVKPPAATGKANPFL